jgi:succinate dehydrogenase / fumarate reductase membrane anchor subunit
MKSATGLTGSGSRDWYIQRECCCLAVYTVVIFGWILLQAALALNNGLAL